MVQKLRLDLARRKRHLLLSSLRAASANPNPSERKVRESPGIAEKGDTGIRSRIGCLDAEGFFSSREIAGRRRYRANTDVDTMADLEPYQREILMQRPTTFGHRPNSASRMFSPSMATSFLVSGGREVELRDIISRRHTAKPTKEKRKTRRALGLSAFMLKELLSGSFQSRYWGVKAPAPTMKDAGRTKGLGSSDGLLGRRESSHSYRCRSSVSTTDVINPLEQALGDASASRPSQVRMGNWLAVQSELRRIFSDVRRVRVNSSSSSQVSQRVAYATPLYRISKRALNDRLHLTRCQCTLDDPMG